MILSEQIPGASLEHLRSSVPASNDFPAGFPASEAAGPHDDSRARGFAAFGLAPELLAAIADLGYVEPTTVQQQAIGLALPHADGSRDSLMVSSQTGSGKTAAFLLPVLHALVQMRQGASQQEQAMRAAQVASALARGEPVPGRKRRPGAKNPRHLRAAVPSALVLAPTRELAQQVASDAIDLLRHCRGLRVAHVVGGMPYGKQIQQLQNADLVVATPGRLLDLQGSGKLDLGQVRFLVVDEADRMLDLGFADALARIHALTAQREQTLMFSATFAAPIQKLAQRILPGGDTPVRRLQIDTPQHSQEHIRQELYWADNRRHRRRLLDHWLRDASIDQAIVFARTQVECEALARDLFEAGFAAASLHGGLTQALRNRRLKALRDGRVRFLIATDVAARGIDVPSITHVFNYGLPMKAEDYTHRIGRTGRAGRSGLAVTLAEIDDRRILAAIEADTRKAFVPLVISGLEPAGSFPSVSAPSGSGPRRKPQGQRARGKAEAGKHRRKFKAAGQRAERDAMAHGQPLQRKQEGRRPDRQQRPAGR